MAEAQVRGAVGVVQGGIGLDAGVDIALDARQRQEAGLRAKAERRLGELTAAGEKGQSKAYDDWLKANAQLRSMGIYPLPLPDALRDYAATLDLDE